MKNTFSMAALSFLSQKSCGTDAFPFIVEANFSALQDGKLAGQLDVKVCYIR